MLLKVECFIFLLLLNSITFISGIGENGNDKLKSY